MDSLDHQYSALHHTIELCCRKYRGNALWQELFKFAPWVLSCAKNPEHFQIVPYVSEDLLHLHRPITQQQAYECVFINGRYEEALSQLPEAVSVLSLSEAQSVSPHLLREYHVEENPLAFLNAVNADGVVLYIAENTYLDRPLRIRHIFSVPSSRTLRYISSPKIVLMLGAHAHAHVCLDVMSGEGIVNGVSDICVLKHAELFIETSFRSNQDGHVNWTNFVQVEENAACVLAQAFEKSFAGCGQFENHFSLLGERARVEALASVFSPEHIGIKNTVFHHAEHTYSQQAIKSIVYSGKFSFEGEIHISSQGQFSKAYQKHDTLLLQDSGTVTTFPRLTILADDVKASHGASIGTLNHEHLFYLRSRGMSEQDARDRLTRGFLTQMVSPNMFQHLVLEQLQFGACVC